MLLSAFSNEIFFDTVDENVIYQKNPLDYFSFFLKFTISLCRISGTSKEEVFAWRTQSLYCCVSISVLKTKRKTKPSNLYLYWLLHEKKKKSYSLHCGGSIVLVLGCRHEVHCLWWDNVFWLTKCWNFCHLCLLPNLFIWLFLKTWPFIMVDFFPSMVTSQYTSIKECFMISYVSFA